MRTADLLAGLSRVGDLGFALPVGSALRSAILATRLAESLDLPNRDVQAAFYTALLHHVGCVGHAHETARLLGDELAANRAAGRTDAGSPTDLLTTFLPTLLRGRGPLERARLTLRTLTVGSRWGDELTATACEVSRDVARRLDLPNAVQESVFHVYDLWHGRNLPQGVSGEDIPAGARVARLCGLAVLFDGLGGPDAAVAEVRRRSGGMLDPGLVDHFTSRAAVWLADPGAHDLLLAVEPAPHLVTADPRAAAEAFGDLVDLKSPSWAGHARAVARLATEAGRRLGLPADTVTDLELAGLLHDVGRVAVSSATWEKAGALTDDDLEQVRLHPYYTERILAGSAELARVAPLAGRHHERLDGSGYHRGSTAADQSAPCRVLAAASRYRAWTEHRPHRAALDPEQAARRLLDEADGGRLDEDAVHAVLAAAGHRPPSRPRPAGGLSEREIEVLGLLAHGCGNAEIGARLVISRRTAEHHVQHIYTKIGVSSRAAATLYAVEHGLLDRDG
jgi:HD-GYP domain-containing protein (c-di-GMP phosphodiesterase class II)